MTEKTAEPEINWDELRPQLIKMALELGPLVVFFVAMPGRTSSSPPPGSWRHGAFALACPGSSSRRSRSCRWSPAWWCWSLAALTLWLQDDTFIKIKPTITNTLFATVLLGGLLFGHSLLNMCLATSTSYAPMAGAS